MRDLIDSYTSRILAEYPDAVGIFLKGSHARGAAGVWSDIDFDVLVSTPDVEDYRTWLEPQNGRLIHISAAVESIEAWESDANEPVPWSFGLPVRETTRLIWSASDEYAERLDHPYRAHPAAPLEVEDAVEGLTKVRNALRRKDEIAVFRSAQKLAKLIPGLLVSLNPPVYPANPLGAIRCITEFPVAPIGFVEDWLACAGFAANRTVESVAGAAERLVRGVLPMLPADPELVGGDIARLLADGSLIAYITQDDAQ